MFKMSFIYKINVFLLQKYIIVKDVVTRYREQPNKSLVLVTLKEENLQ